MLSYVLQPLKAAVWGMTEGSYVGANRGQLCRG